MLNIVRRSQIQGLMTMDSSTVTQLGEVEEVWLDSTGRVAQLSSVAGYLPLQQVADIGSQVISTYGRLLVDPPSELISLDRLMIQSPLGEPLGWVEDFLFDWHTGEIAAYILAGAIADPFGERVVLYPADVQEITATRLVIRSGAQDRLQPESQGLAGFLSERSHQVRHLVKEMSDRLHHLIAPHDKPEVVRVKVKQVSDELAASGKHEHHFLQEATEYLQNQWESLQQSISRAGGRAKAALDQAWKQLTARK